MSTRRRIRHLALACAGLAAMAIVVPRLAAASAPLAAPTTPCQVTDQVNQWTGGFTAAITVTNNGPALTSWTVTWTFDGSQQITSAWNAMVTQTGAAVSAVNESYNGSVPTGGQVNFGFQGTFSGTNDVPVNFAVNGQACNGQQQPPTTTTTPPPPTTTAPPTTTTPPTTTAPPTTTTGGGTGCAASVFCDGFESQTGTAPSGRWATSAPDCSGTGTVAIGGAQVHTGTKALQVNGTDGFCNHIFATDTTDMAAASPTWFVRFWIRHTTALPTGHVTFLAMTDSANNNTHLRLGGQNGALMWNRESDDATLPAQSPQGVAQSVQLPVNTWTCIEFSVSGGTGQIQTWVNGTAVPGLTEDGVPTPDIDQQWLSGAGANWRPKLTDLSLGWESYGGGGPDTLAFDDVALGTSRIGCG